MATTSQTDIAVAPEWVDITVAYPSLANVDVCLQNKSGSGEPVFVVAGGSKPTSQTAGVLLERGDYVNLNTDHIWVFAQDGGAPDDLLSVTLLGS